MLAYARATVKRNLPHHQRKPHARSTNQPLVWGGVMGVCGVESARVAGAVIEATSRREGRRVGQLDTSPPPSHPVLSREAVAQRTRAYKMFGS